MQTQNFINILLLFSYIALSVDVVLQIARIEQRHSSRDISIRGDLLRFAAVTVLVIKFVVLGDTVLIIGQSILSALLLIYTIMLIRMRRRKSTKKSKNRG